MMIEQHWGRIITIVSIAAKQPIDELLLSSAIRPGILGLTKVLANLHGKDNVTVIPCAPDIYYKTAGRTCCIAWSTEKNDNGRIS